MKNDNFTPGIARMFLTRWGARFYAWRARRRGFQTEITDNGKGQTQELGGRYSVSLKVAGGTAKYKGTRWHQYE